MVRLFVTSEDWQDTAYSLLFVLSNNRVSERQNGKCIIKGNSNPEKDTCARPDSDQSPTSLGGKSETSTDCLVNTLNRDLRPKRELPPR